MNINIVCTEHVEGSDPGLPALLYCLAVVLKRVQNRKLVVYVV